MTTCKAVLFGMSIWVAIGHWSFAQSGIAPRVQVDVATDRAEYWVGDPVAIRVIVTNASDEPIDVAFGCPCCDLDVAIEDSDGVVVARWIDETSCWQIPEVVTLSAGVSGQGFHSVWRQTQGEFGGGQPPGDPVEPGRYRVVAEWFGHPGRGVFRQEFEILDDSAAVVQYIPVAASAPGRNGTLWNTTLFLRSRGFETVDVEIEALAQEQDNSDPGRIHVEVGGGRPTVIDDVMVRLGIDEGSAALRLRTRAPLDAFALISNTAGDGNLSQRIPAVRPRDSSRSVVVHGLAPSSPGAQACGGEPCFRANLGLVNLASWPVTIRFGFEVNGVFVSDLPPAMVEIEPFGFRQVNDVLRPFNIAPLALDLGIDAVVTSTSAPILVYGSVVDNRSGDAYFVSGTAIWED